VPQLSRHANTALLILFLGLLTQNLGPTTTGRGRRIGAYKEELRSVDSKSLARIKSGPSPFSAPGSVGIPSDASVLTPLPIRQPWPC
jgi:hypothetical protein